MNLVIDANRVIAEMLKSSVCREIILHEAFEFYAPDFLVSEIQKHRSYICTKAGLKERNFNILLYILFENIRLVPYEEFSHCLDHAIEIMEMMQLNPR